MMALFRLLTLLPLHFMFAIIFPYYFVPAQVRNDKARKFLSAMRPKAPTPLEQAFPAIGRPTLAVLRRMLAFDPSQRPTADEVLRDPYFKGRVTCSRSGVLLNITACDSNSKSLQTLSIDKANL